MSIQTSVYCMTNFALNYERAASLPFPITLHDLCPTVTSTFSLDPPHLAYLCSTLAQISLHVLVCFPEKLTSCISVGFVLCLSLALDLS